MAGQGNRLHHSFPHEMGSHCGGALSGIAGLGRGKRPFSVREGLQSCRQPGKGHSFPKARPAELEMTSYIGLRHPRISASSKGYRTAEYCKCRHG